MKKGFNIPEAVLNQLNECTTGYILISVNENGGFQLSLDDSKSLVTYSGLLNYASMQIDCLMEKLHHDIASKTIDLDDGADD